MKGRRAIIVVGIILVVGLLIVTGNFPPRASGGPGGGGGGDGGGSGEGQTFTGTGKTTTDPFQLDGGEYRLTWWIEGDRACQYEARLRSSENQLVNQGAGKIFNPTGKHTEKVTLVNRVSPGTYYFQVNTTCRWSITVNRLEE